METVGAEADCELAVTPPPPPQMLAHRGKNAAPTRWGSKRGWGWGSPKGGGHARLQALGLHLHLEEALVVHHAVHGVQRRRGRQPGRLSRILQRHIRIRHGAHHRRLDAAQQLAHDQARACSQRGAGVSAAMEGLREAFFDFKRSMHG